VSRLVLKIGGSSVEGAAARVRDLRAAGHEIVVVHGAGSQISVEMRRRGLEVRFVEGRRVTTRAGLEVVRESLEAVNAQVCAAIGRDAVGLAGDEIGLAAERIPRLGLVGTALPSRPPAVVATLAAGLVPVVTPLARGPLNVNADEAASGLAVGIGAARIQFLTDVPGVFHEGELLGSIAAEHAESLIGAGSFDGGIVPKLLAAVRAARGGLVAEIGQTAVLA
jgi:acetylglutamate kinase